MSRLTTAVGLLAALSLTACVSQDQFRRQAAELDALRRERDALADYSKGLEDRNKQLTGEVERLGASAADAAWIADQKKKLQAMMDSLGQSGSLDIEGVSVRQSAAGTIVEVQGEVLFASGKVQITDDGKATLRKLLPSLRDDGRRLRIEGHTDNDPIVHSQWKTNLRLSAERALSVGQYLIDEGFPIDRLAIAGYGEHTPRVATDDDSAKQANRRVEILLLDR